MAKSKKIKNMSYLPLSLTQNETVNLNGYSVTFQKDGDNYVTIGSGYLDSCFKDASGNKTNIYQDNSSVTIETQRSTGEKTVVYVSGLDVRTESFDTNVSSNPASQIITHSNGDALLNGARIQVNGQLALNGDYQVGDKTFTITNGIITNIQ